MKTTDEKLTLKLKRTSIARAKAIAKKRGTSVSRMVEEYFDLIAPRVPLAKEVSDTPIVDSLVLGLKPMPDFDWKEERTKYLLKKYGYK